MAEAETEAAVETPAVEPVVETAPESKEDGAEETTEDRGNQEVYQRKSHQAVKKLEGELQAEREARIRLEEQVRYLSTAAVPAATKPQVYTPDEVQAAVDAGRIKAAEGASYLARIEAHRVILEREQKQAASIPIDAAIAEINEHRRLNPWIDDKSDPRRKQIENEYRRMVNRGQRRDEVTELDALEKVVGSLDLQRKRIEMANLTRSHSNAHAEVSGGGDATEGSRVDLSKATPTMLRRWEQTKTAPKDRAEELRIYQALKAGKRVV